MFDIHQYDRDQDDEIDHEAYGKYIDGLLEEFAKSPEGAAFREQHGDPGYAALMMRYAMDYDGVSPPEMSAGDFERVVFGLFPRKVSTQPESAPVIVAELRALWTFLQRAHELKNAAAILGKLGPGAEARLHRELADPSNYGMAKSFFMTGQKMGFDMTTQEGLQAFMLYYNSQLLNRASGPTLGPPPLGDFSGFDDFDDYEDDAPLLPGPAEMTPKKRAEMRKKKKAQRQARKRNRKKK